MHEEKLTTEFGSVHPIRVITNSEASETTICIDCEAQSLRAKLQSFNLETEMIYSLKVMQETLIFILENTDWPVSD